MDRRFDQKGDIMVEPNPLPVVCALVLHKDRVLATRRDRAGQLPLMWEFPGGKIEPGECAEGALHRELEEELGLRVRVRGHLKSVIHQDEHRPIQLVPFVCVPDQDHAPVPVDHAELRWISAETAQQLTWAPADIPLVAQLKDLLS